LQARTDADGMLAGLIAQGAAGSFQVAASLSYDGSKADTDRTLSGGSKVSSHYRLSNWTADLSLGHAFAWSNDWTITPEIGVTHISSRRSGANETGDAVWALDVEARRIKATFLRGALELRGSVEAQISPWLSAGMLHQLSGARPSRRWRRGQACGFRRSRPSFSVPAANLGLRAAGRARQLASGFASETRHRYRC
jgi:outer membrane autotransporter protein